jgi:FeS assembly protein IscX
MKWIDTREIALALAQTYTDIDPRTIRFTDLHRWVCTLPGFTDGPEHSNEKILEAIQMAWLDEYDEDDDM